MTKNSLELKDERITLIGGRGRWKKVVIRPVFIKDVKHWQLSYFDETKDISKNYLQPVAKKKLKDLVTQGYAIVSRKKVKSLAHDLTKAYILPADRQVDWLVKIRIQTKDGKIKADRRDKWKQINQFLKNLKECWDQADITEDTINVVDFGCGNAYLTFATAYFFKEIVKRPIKLVGIDKNAELVKRNNQIAKDLKWRDVEFVQRDIENYEPGSTVQVALSLHACDTASDKAIVKAVNNKSQLILIAPCCHYYLQQQLSSKKPFMLLFEDGILKQRLGDILTDSLRAGWLKSKGYRTDVVQFIDSVHTPKNLLIRAIKKPGINTKRYELEYQQLKDYWNIDPYLG